MSKSQLARRIAEETGTTIQRARRFVDDVGPRTAEEALEAAQTSARSFPWRTAIAGGAATGIGGGMLYWRDQDVRKAEALADQSESYEEAIGDIIESDLPSHVKEDLLNDIPTGDEEDEDGWLDELRDAIPGWPDTGAGSILYLVVALIVLMAFLNYQQGGTSQ